MEAEKRPYSENIACQVELPLLCVEDGHCEHAIKHGDCFFGAETLIEVDYNLGVALRLEAEFVVVAQSERVVYFTVVYDPDVRVGVEAHRLHPERHVVDLQPVETQNDIRHAVDGLDA